MFNVKFYVSALVGVIINVKDLILLTMLLSTKKLTLEIVSAASTVGHVKYINKTAYKRFGCDCGY